MHVKEISVDSSALVFMCSSVNLPHFVAPFHNFEKKCYTLKYDDSFSVMFCEQVNEGTGKKSKARSRVNE